MIFQISHSWQVYNISKNRPNICMLGIVPFQNLSMFPSVFNTQNMTNPTIVSPVKMEYGWNFSISGLKFSFSEKVTKMCEICLRGRAAHKLCRLKIGDFWPPPPLLVLVVFLLSKIGNFDHPLPPRDNIVYGRPLMVLTFT